MSTSFDETYFEDGVEEGVSCYENYRWLGKPTIEYCQAVIRWLDLRSGSTLLDFGCAKGFYVKAFRLLGIDAWGSDISQYAIENCDPDVRSWLEWTESWKICASGRVFDLIFSKDVLEHIPDLDKYLSSLRYRCNRMLVAVPLGDDIGFLCESANRDKTHVHCQNEYWWHEKLNKYFPLVWRANRIPDVEQKHQRGYGYFLASNE